MTKEVKMKIVTDLADVTEHLEHILEAIKAGSIHVEKNGDAVTLNPKEKIYFYLEAKQKKESSKLIFEMKWYKDDKKKREDDQPLTISSKVAEVVNEAKKALDDLNEKK